MHSPRHRVLPVIPTSPTVSRNPKRTPTLAALIHHPTATAAQDEGREKCESRDDRHRRERTAFSGRRVALRADRRRSQRTPPAPTTRRGPARSAGARPRARPVQLPRTRERRRGRRRARAESSWHRRATERRPPGAAARPSSLRRQRGRKARGRDRDDVDDAKAKKRHAPLRRRRAEVASGAFEKAEDENGEPPPPAKNSMRSMWASRSKPERQAKLVAM